MDSTVAVPVWGVGVMAFALVALLLIVWSVKRRTRPKLSTASHGETNLEPTVAGLLQSTFVGGNAIEILQNGAFFEQLFADLARARSNINIELFLAKRGETTKRLTDLLLGRAGEGVEVRLLLDASGGKNFGRDDIRRLRDAGCVVRDFHPFVPSNLGRLNQRTHRKIVVIDGRIGYVGGHCFVDSWLGDAEDKKHFRDLTARVEGPVVTQIQSAFTDNWIEETGDVISGEKFFPKQEEAGTSRAQVVFVSPTGGPSTLKLLHYIAINEAKESITIQNPYFLPDPDAREALLAAVKRGVDVRIMIPADQATDAPLVQHACHHHYGTLLRGGVRIFDYQRTLLHQKVFTIDHAWCSIGSTNFDDRSFEINDEVSLVIFDEQIAQELEAIFERDLAHAKERHFQEWKNRPALHKLRDFTAFLFNEQM